MNISLSVARLNQAITVVPIVSLCAMISCAGEFVYSTCRVINEYKYVSALSRVQVMKNINKLKYYNVQIQEEGDGEIKKRIIDEKNSFYYSIIPMDVPEVGKLEDEIDLRLNVIRIFEYPFYAACIVLTVVFVRGFLSWGKDNESCKYTAGLGRKKTSSADARVRALRRR